MRRKIRTMIVDDSAFMRKALMRMLTSDPQIEVVAQAGDGEQAVELLQTCRPDVVTLDVQMPGMDGLVTLQRIMAIKPVPVLMVSSLTSEGGETTLRALELGAVDFIDKSSCHTQLDILEIADSLLAKVKAIAGIDLEKIRKSPAAGEPAITPQKAAATPEAPLTGKFPSHLVVIGASTGGPMTLDQILTRIPGDFPGAILIVQHMPIGFTHSFAQRLNQHCHLNVKEAQEDDPLLAGCAYVGPGGYHIGLHKKEGRLCIALSKHPYDTKHCPSVDVLFESAARWWEGPLMGLVLTGMGEDGMLGIKAIKARPKGGNVIAQNEETCVVYGMPKAAWQTGCVDKMIPLDSIAREIAVFGGRARVSPRSA